MAYSTYFRGQNVALVFACIAYAWLGPSLASAQVDEVIVDPERSDSALDDEEKLGEEESRSEATRDEEDLYDPLANTGLGKLELLGQQAMDLHREGALEDVYESRLRLDVEVTLRRSRTVRLVLGNRLDFLWAVPGQDDPIVSAEGKRALAEDRFELDSIPTAAYVDLTLWEGLHMRIGQQVLSLGRMDFYSPNDALAVFDLRPQPKLDPASAKLAQPALRIDWDLTTRLSLSAAYVPWFTPHLSRPTRDRYIAEVLTGKAARQPDPKLIDPSFQPKASEWTFRTMTPAPDFTSPQGQARLLFRGTTSEWGLTIASALEKLPTVYLTPALESYLADPKAHADALKALGFATFTDADSPSLRAQPLPLFDVAYHRYTLLGIDGSVDLAPISVGFELAYSPSRHLYTASSDGRTLLRPDTLEPLTDNIPVANAKQCKIKRDDACVSNVKSPNIRAGVPVIQSALHLEWIKGDSLVLVAEGFFVQALYLPHDLARDWAGFIPGTGLYAGGAVSASGLVADGMFRFEATLMSAVGPSLITVAQMEVRLNEHLYANVGTQLFEGNELGVGQGTQRRVVGAQNLSIGALYDGYDQVFVGFRYLP